jgi:hypothetical protein
VVDEPTPEVKGDVTPEEEDVKTPESTTDEKAVAQVQVQVEEKAADAQEEDKDIAVVEEDEEAVAVITPAASTPAVSEELSTSMEDVQRTRNYLIPRVPRTKFASKLVPGSILGKHSTDTLAPTTKKPELGAVSPMDALTFEPAVLDLNLPHKWGLVKVDDEKFFGKEVPAETLGKRPAGYDDEDGEDGEDEVEEKEEEERRGKKVKMSHPVGVPMVRRRVYRVR